MTQTAVFYCPLKPPEAERPSGVSRVGGLFVQALQAAGYRVEIPDLPPAYDGAGDSAVQQRLQEIVTIAAQKYLRRIVGAGVAPELWFTYHCYYKSPDLIGPIVAKAAGCTYAIAEGSYARKREVGAWSSYHEAARKALAAADILLAATERDRDGLLLAKGPNGAVIDFPPFIDCAPFELSLPLRHISPVRILAAGSMRDRRKLRSYERLFSSLSHLEPSTFSLTIAGDGPFRADVEAHARACGVQARFLGQLPPSAMPEFFAQGDVFAWPGFGEAYGLTYLEAQASGLPVVAENHGGVSACVKDGISGFLTAPDDSMGYSHALKRMVEDSTARRRFSVSARAWVLAERSLPVAAARLREILTRRR